VVSASVPAQTTGAIGATSEAGTTYGEGGLTEFGLLHRYPTRLVALSAFLYTMPQFY